MNTNEDIVVHFEDKYGQKRTIRGTRHGLKLKRLNPTLLDRINPTISQMAGIKIKQARIEAGMTLKELCVKAGLASTTPKSRMWEIENSTRKNGTRLGTLYLIAMALDLEIADLLPTTFEVKRESGIKEKNISSFEIN